MLEPNNEFSTFDKLSTAGVGNSNLTKFILELRTTYIILPKRSLKKTGQIRKFVRIGCVGGQ